MTTVGECILQRVEDLDHPSGFRIRVIRADPRILVSRKLLEDIDRDHPWVMLADDVLTIRAENQTVVYRLGRCLPSMGAYEAEWPD